MKVGRRAALPLSFASHHLRRFVGLVWFTEDFALYKFGRGRCPRSVNMIQCLKWIEIANAPVLALLTLCVASVAFGADADHASGERKLDPRLQSYFIAKEREARALAKQLDLQVQPEVWEYFAAGAKGEWTAADRLFDGISRKWRDDQERTPLAGPILEAVLAYENFSSMEMKHVEAFARDVIDSIPAGSIYFGGSDPGRGLVTAFVKSLPEANPFFVLSQNPFADRGYLEYVRATYGKKLSLPTEADLKKALDDYAADAEARMKEDKLKPGEVVGEDETGKLQPKSSTAWMEVNARLTKMVFDRNPRHEFYIEESMPIDWMYPYLSPHGLILKLNRKPLTELTEKVVTEDHEYWRQQMKRLVGDWLTNETAVKVLCEFVEDVYDEQNLDGFRGDEEYVVARRGRNTQFLYAHLRNGQAHVYEWRMNHGATPNDKERMMRELDFAYRQAIALCPHNVETVKRYVNLLRDQNRLDDARRMLRTGRMVNPRSKRLQELATDLN
jgi:hypothetical protein